MSEQDRAVALRAEAILRELEPVFDISIRIAVEVGRLRLSVRDLMKLAPDSVIELKKPAGDPFDIYMNGVQIARGEVIVLDQTAGVRIVDIQKLGGANS
jgi:flagellar motor switch protein FliN/FliY